jgi:hypothetical protein
MVVQQLWLACDMGMVVQQLWLACDMGMVVQQLWLVQDLKQVGHVFLHVFHRCAWSLESYAPPGFSTPIDTDQVRLCR